MKKVISLLLVIALTAAVAISGTMAYLTDRENETNVFTMGNVEIELNGNFEQGAELMPGKEIALKPTITNTGDNDAWVFLTFAIPSALDNYVQGTEQGSNENVIHWNPKGATTEGYVTDERVQKAISEGFFDGFDTTGLTGDYIVTNEMHWNVFDSLGEDQNAYQTTIKVNEKDVSYNVYVLLYNKKLTPNETTLPNIEKVFLDARVDIDPEGQLHFVENGKVTELMWNVNTNGTPVVFVNAFGIQTDTFANVQAAFNAYKTQWGDLQIGSGDITIAEEIGITEGGTYNLTDDVYTIDTGYFHTQKVTEDVTINGNGATVEGIATSVDAFQWEGGTIPAMSPIFSSADGSKVIVNDLTFTGTMSAVMLGHYQNATYNNYNTELNNVKVINAEVVSFSPSVSPAVCVYGTAVLNNCQITGTTLSELDTDPMWPVYDLVAVNYTDVTLNNTKVGSIMMWNQAKITVAAGSEVERLVVLGNMNNNNTNNWLIIQKDAKVDAIDLSNITNVNRVKIVIEDGASVGAFVDNGVEYATLDAWKAAQ